MAGKPKFDQEAAFKSIIGQGREPVEDSAEQPAPRSKYKDRVQRSYFLDRDVDKALRRMALEEEKTLTEAVNDVLRKGLEKYF
ncbi:MAG: hypothetical protein J1F18_14195 [Lachnospiraceae bacterium]|nr:hypothetical protein [Lachnospiraceae bacterium]